MNLSPTRGFVLPPLLPPDCASVRQAEVKTPVADDGYSDGGARYTVDELQEAFLNELARELGVSREELNL